LSIENVTNVEDSFLSQVPVALLEENILTQFRNPDNFRMDYIASFISSYKYSLGMIEDDDEKMELVSQHDEFMNFMQDTLFEKLGIGINNFGEMSYEEQEDLVHFVYRFFIINMKQNFFNLFLNYINRNKEMLLENAVRRKDVTSQAFKRELPEEDTIILANLSDIMNYVINDAELTVDDFLELCEGESPSTELTLMSEYYDDFIITGNFIERYTRMLRIPMRIRIEGDIRNRILKKYREENPLLPRENQDTIEE